MHDKFRLLVVLLILSAGSSRAQDEPRPMVDTVGFCTTKKQVRKVADLAATAERENTRKTSKLLKNKKYFAAVCPHDDHLLSARAMIHVLPGLAASRTVVIFGVTHRAARKSLGDPQGVILLDDRQTWQAPFGPVPVDTGLREHIRKILPARFLGKSGRAFALEHSIEAMLPLLQLYNRKVRILPIMVTGADFDTMRKMAAALAGVLDDYMSDHRLEPRKDIAFIISNDATHYGPDFDYAPFGTDERAHTQAFAQDRNLVERYLAGEVTEKKLEGFVGEISEKSIPWCGRYTVPFGLLLLKKLAQQRDRRLSGILLRHADSYTLGTLPAYGIGLGTTAPFSLKHWVGYLSIAYVLD